MDSIDGKVFTVTIDDLYADVQRLQAENAELRKRLEHLEYHIRNLSGTIDELAGAPNDKSLFRRVSSAVYVARKALVGG